jgi:hypothetical protein
MPLTGPGVPLKQLTSTAPQQTLPVSLPVTFPCPLGVAVTVLTVGTPEDVVDMRRYLLVLDTDLLALDDKLGQEPINYLLQQQEQEQSEVVVLSLAGQTKLSSLELVLGGATSGIFAPAKSPITPQPDHDLMPPRSTG